MNKKKELSWNSLQTVVQSKAKIQTLSHKQKNSVISLIIKDMAVPFFPNDPRKS